MKKTGDPIVYIADNDPQMRETLGLLVESVGIEFEAYTSAEDFLADCSYLGQKPECLLLGLCLPGMNGLNLMERLREEGIGIPIIIVTAFADVSTAVEAMKFGAVDLFEKPFSRVRLLGCIRTELDRQAEKLRDEELYAAARERLASLTERERDVMDLMFTGKTAKQIGSYLEIGIKTVAKHRTKVFEKFKVDNTVELIHFFYQCDLAKHMLKPKSH